MIWTENGVNRWDRLETTPEVKELLKQLEMNEGVCETDVWIFAPEADNYALEYEAFVGTN